MGGLIGLRATNDKGDKEAKQGLSIFFSSISYRRSSTNMRQAYDNFCNAVFGIRD